MQWLVDVFTGSGLASIVGLAGGMVNKYFEAKAKKDQYAYELRMRKYDIEESALERSHEMAIADKNIERAKVEGEIKIGTAEMQAFNTSQRYGQSDKNWWVRPVVTFYLLITCTVLFVAVWRAVGGLTSFTNEDLVTLLDYMVRSAIYLAVMCVGWWFGSRPGNVLKR